MKRIRIKMTDTAGMVYWWTVWREPNAVNLKLSQKPRKISGWQYRDHEGCERFSEGNWMELVSHLRATAHNYGFITNIS